MIEHFSVYNVRDLNEHWRVAITLSCARSDWCLTRGLSRKLSVLGASKRAPAFLHLEEEVLRFHCAFRHFWDRRLRMLGAAHAAAAAAADGADGQPAPLAAERVLAVLPPALVFGGLGDDAEHNALWFAYRFVTDEFVFYGVEGSASMAVVLQLAVLCYSVRAAAMLRASPRAPRAASVRR